MNKDLECIGRYLQVIRDAFNTNRFQDCSIMDLRYFDFSNNPYDVMRVIEEINEYENPCWINKAEKNYWLLQKHLQEKSRYNILYFIQVSDNELKIGSANDEQNFYKRLQECQRWCKTPIVLGVSYCDRKAEKYSHHCLKEYKLVAKGKELFRLEDSVRRFISAHSDWSIYNSNQWSIYKKGFSNHKDSQYQCTLDQYLSGEVAQIYENLRDSKDYIDGTAPIEFISYHLFGS